MPENKKFIFSFGNGKGDGLAGMRELLGGKGAGLHEMTRVGIPVPPGFTITTEVCTYFASHRQGYPKGLQGEVQAALSRVETMMGRRFGDAKTPLLVSVRSGARESMPGMMDTVLNLGLNPQTVEGLAANTQNPRFAYDSYRRFVQMYGDVVMKVRGNSDGEDPFENLLQRKKAQRNLRLDTELSAQDWKE